MTAATTVEWDARSSLRARRLAPMPPFVIMREDFPQRARVWTTPLAVFDAPAPAGASPRPETLHTPANRAVTDAAAAMADIVHALFRTLLGSANVPRAGRNVRSSHGRVPAGKRAGAVRAMRSVARTTRG
mmetsp:Transcript_3603/g.16500  ORF Transcript_3603/g.16500 Transcript_3603/m.16500 type:complete len:130 (-) Transcript_3603:86-475(-)